MGGLKDFKKVAIGDLLPKPTEGVTTMTGEEWLAKGKQLFGDDMTKWRFVCPGCGHVQAVEDFRQYKDQGASPDSARQECIGRYSGGKPWAFKNVRKLGGPCDYAGYGLLNICPVKVVDEKGDHWCFAFDEKGGNHEDTGIRE